MRVIMRWIKLPILTNLAFAIVLLGCAGTTLTYRDIQDDFNTAVQADNAESVNSLLGIVNSQALYGKVLDSLTDEMISSLDQKLKLNAYTIRAVSQWRSGKLAEAKVTAREALALDLPSGPRDKMVLQIIPAVVNDQDILYRYRELPDEPRLEWEEYERVYEKDYIDAVKHLDAAVKLASQTTHPDTILYVHFQRWRILNNWNYFINKLWDGENPQCDPSRTLRQDAGARATHELGRELSAEIESENEFVPVDHPLRRLMKDLTLR